MWDMGAHGWGWIGIGAVHMLLFWGFIILAIIAIVRWLGSDSSGPQEGGSKTALDILKERYARGELEREEFERMRRDLEN